MRISILQRAGSFAENKDVARSIRVELIQPHLSQGTIVTLDFEGVDLATQSFIHALLSEVIRTDQGSALDLLEFSGCNRSIQNLIEIVSAYSQDTVDDDS